MNKLTEYIQDQIWILEYPIRYGGMDLFARMTVIVNMPIDACFKHTWIPKTSMPFSMQHNFVCR